MKRFVFSFAVIGMMAIAARASTVTYTTADSTLSCNSVAGCTQVNPDEVEIGTVPGSYLTLTYTAGSGTAVQPPSYIDFGHLTAAVGAGTPSGLSISGLLLTINITSTPPGAPDGTIPGGSISGTISYNGSTGQVSFGPANTTTSFGTLPGVTIGSYVYQVTNSPLSLVSPNSGNPLGQTSIQGAVTQLVSSTPEPVSLGLVGGSLVGLAVFGRRLLRRAKS